MNLIQKLMELSYQMLNEMVKTSDGQGCLR